MDPWLERSWGDVHQSFIIYLREALNAKLPEPLAARVEERVFIESPIASDRKFIPDVRVVEYPARPAPGGAAVVDPATEAPADPYLLDFAEVEVTESLIEIRDFASGGRVVTLVELVSRSNKSGGEGQDKYLQKQREALDGRINVVEIDLLRGGRGVTLAGQRHAPRQMDCPYHASIHRQTRPTRVEFYPIALRSSLPRLRFPLRPHDADVVVGLQQVLAQTYAAGRYATTTDYDRPPEPPLSPDDDAWARQRIAAWRAARPA
jgi:hypothetical protein